MQSSHSVFSALISHSNNQCLVYNCLILACFVCSFSELRWIKVDHGVNLCLTFILTFPQSPLSFLYRRLLLITIPLILQSWTNLILHIAHNNELQLKLNTITIYWLLYIISWGFSIAIMLVHAVLFQVIIMPERPKFWVKWLCPSGLTVLCHQCLAEWLIGIGINRICYLCLTEIDLSQSRVVCCYKSQSRL